jgi:transaldolase
LSNNIQKLYKSGQSIWCDNISRGMIESGELQRLIDLGIVGITSNPTIFMKAITGTADYDPRFKELLEAGKDLGGIYEGLVLADIADAADILRPVYDRTKGADGYVSLEVDPKLAHDTEGTIAEARRLFAALDRPNILIKVPATDAGLPAVETLIGDGINVNVTLIFAIEMYEKVMDAYLAGLKKRLAAGQDVSNVASVASFFVSRVDTLVDKLLDARHSEGARVTHLYGKAANANAKLAYARFLEVFDESGGFADLAAQGARVQRPLWASTSTKNPKYPDTLYVDPLVGPNTVNTLPPATIEAVLDHGRTEVTISDGLNDAQALVNALSQLGIDMKAVTDQLLAEGVDAFAKSFEQLMDNLALKQEQLTART